MTVSFADDTITVVRAARITERGDTILDWSTTTEHPVERCRWQPSGGTDIGGRRRGVDVAAVVHTPIDADITEDDRIRWEGVTYEIDGPINRWRSVTGYLAHCKIALKVVRG